MGNQDLSQWSIGKLKAFLQQRGIKASNMKRPQLEEYTQRTMDELNKPITFQGEQLGE